MPLDSSIHQVTQETTSSWDINEHGFMIVYIILIICERGGREGVTFQKHKIICVLIVINLHFMYIL